MVAEVDMEGTRQPQVVMGSREGHMLFSPLVWFKDKEADAFKVLGHTGPVKEAMGALPFKEAKLGAYAI